VNVLDIACVALHAGIVYFNESDINEGLSIERMKRILRTYVRSVYRYQRQHIYDVVFYQYQQDSDRRQLTGAGSLTAAESNGAARDLIMELIGDAQQVSLSETKTSLMVVFLTVHLIFAVRIREWKFKIVFCSIG
jgi:hypothetical protein